MARVHWYVAGALVSVAVVIAIVVRTRGHATTVPIDAAVIVERVAPVAIPTDAAVAVKATSTYIGSERCADCHADEHARWQTSWHARALAPGTGKAVVGTFANAHFTGTSSEAWMRRRGDTATMRTRGADGALADYRVDWVIGGKRMQDNVTVLPDGRWQVLPVYFHVTGKAWVDYTEAKQGALTPDHPFFWTNSRRMANHECLDCHTTALHVEYDERAKRWKTEFVDGNVACEDCHGPGSQHAETSAKGDIVHPVNARAIGMAACARCHGPRKPLYPLLDPEHQFKPGDSYDELYDPIVVTIGNGMSPDFYVDGKPRTSSFEYQAMLQSTCYRKGGADCLTCHTAPHDKAHRKNELRAAPDEVCRQCHATVFAAGARHTHHKAASCLACHMPPVVSGVLDQFVDHAIDVPAPQNRRHGLPDACSTCHRDKTPDALVAAVVEWWPDAATRQARRVRLADAFDPETARTSARPLLVTVIDSTEAPTVRGAAAKVMARRFGPDSARVFLPLLASTDVVLRAKAVEALAMAKATVASTAIAGLLSDRSVRIRLAAALALHDLGDSRGDVALQQLADAPETSHLMLPHLELGQTAGARRDWPAAKRELEWVAKLAPYYADALGQLAAVLVELGELDEARARIDQLLQLEPTHRGGLALRARVTATVTPP
ncbi:MAG: tetratricopeptide repeat protein [Kofleriaceae bacterium]